MDNKSVLVKYHKEIGDHLDKHLVHHQIKINNIEMADSSEVSNRLV